MSGSLVPGWVAGRWVIDSNNSDASFSVRHLGVARVHGRFNEVVGSLVTGESVESSSVSAVIVAGSVDTGFGARDGYIRGGEVLSVEDHKELGFVSTGVRAVGEGFVVEGELSIRGVTRPVVLAVELGGFGVDPQSGRKVLGLSASTTIKRADFGFCKGLPAAVISEAVDIRLDIQATHDA